MNFNIDVKPPINIAFLEHCIKKDNLIFIPSTDNDTNSEDFNLVEDGNVLKQLLQLADPWGSSNSRFRALSAGRCSACLTKFIGKKGEERKMQLIAAIHNKDEHNACVELRFFGDLIFKNIRVVPNIA